MGYQLKPLVCVCITCFATAYATTYIFSFVGFLAVDLAHLESTDEAGFVAGYISGIMYLGRMFSSPLWGYLADHYGRRPTLVFSALSTVIFPALFGLADSVAIAVVMRFLLGFCNGTVTIAKTMVSELTDGEHNALGMSAYTITWSLGLILGPAVSGWTTLLTSDTFASSEKNFAYSDDLVDLFLWMSQLVNLTKIRTCYLVWLHQRLVRLVSCPSCCSF